MSTLPVTEEAGDAELISAVRGGDLSAYGVLFERHYDAARRLARQLTSHADADDLVSDAFAKVMKVLQDGGGPDLAFRAYLLTAVRRLHVDRIRATSRLHTTDDLEPFDPGVPFRDPAVEGFENAAAAKAFASLPERWQLVLWHTEVEGQKPAEVAPLLGMSANSVSALAYRAREGLRQAFLNSHAAELDDAQCRWTHDHLGGYVRHGLSKRDSGKVEKHLDECRGCMAIYLELTEVNSNLGALLAPLLLGTSAGLAYLAGAGGLAAKGGLLLLLGRAKETVMGNTGVAAAGGVVAVTAIAGVSVAMVAGGDDAGKPAAGAAPATSEESRAAPPDSTKSRAPRTRRSTPPAPPPTSTAPEPETESTPDTSAPPAAEDPPPPAEEPPPPAEEPPREDPGHTVTQEPIDPPPDGPDEQETKDPDPSVSDLELTVETSPGPEGNPFAITFTATTSGYPPGGEATLTITRTRPFKIVRTESVTAADNEVVGLLNLLPGTTLEVKVTPDNFTDPNLGNNTWSRAGAPPGQS